MANGLTNLRACCWDTISGTHAAIAAVHETARGGHRADALVVSCQRTEAYGFGRCSCDAPMRFRGMEALFHLAEVAAGLHAVVLGEPQILGQIRGAVREGPVAFKPLGGIAVAAARELRRATDFNSHAGALLDRGLTLAGRRERDSVAVLGAGPMGRLVGERAAHLGFPRIVVLSRERPGWAAGMEWAPLPSAARLAVGVAIGCLGSAAGVRDVAQLPSAALFLDFGTPRNFIGVPRERLITLADLLGDEERRPHAVRRRRELRTRVRELVQVRTASFGKDDTAAQFRRAVEAVRQEALARNARLHPEMDAGHANALTRSLINQLFHDQTVALRGPSSRESAVADLDEPEQPRGSAWA